MYSTFKCLSCLLDHVKVRRQSSNTILSSFFSISGMAISFSRPLRCLYWLLVRSRLNSTTQYFNVVNEGADSPRVESDPTLMLVRLTPFKCKIKLYKVGTSLNSKRQVGYFWVYPRIERNYVTVILTGIKNGLLFSKRPAINVQLRHYKVTLSDFVKPSLQMKIFILRSIGTVIVVSMHRLMKKGRCYYQGNQILEMDMYISNKYDYKFDIPIFLKYLVFYQHNFPKGPHFDHLFHLFGLQNKYICII